MHVSHGVLIVPDLLSQVYSENENDMMTTINTVKQDSIRVKSNTLRIYGDTKGIKAIYLQHGSPATGDSMLDNPKAYFDADSQTAYIAVDRHMQEIKELRSDLFIATGVIVTLLLALGYVWLQNRKMRRYFR